MCGIVGILAFKSTVPEGALERATQALAHRGPDDSGIEIVRAANSDVELGLGHRRLAILDLSPLGHQPMQDSLNGNWIVYNGEIYNFRKLREELKKAGADFVSESDTEVILTAYRIWGESFLAKLEGMFAFGLWDAGKRKLLLARDRLGIKPLFFYQSESHFIFASEVRALLATGLVPRQVDVTGVLSYLEFGSVSEPWTLLKGVRSVPAASSMEIEKGAVKLGKFWDPVPGLPEQRTDRAHAVSVNAENDLASILNEAILSHMVSDVPVGVFLSGGIDSSALVAVLSRNGVRPNTFSLVFSEKEFDEAQYSGEVARRFRCEHHEILISQADALHALPDALSAMDEPTIDGINTFLVSARTRAAGVKVALTGLGADEMFAGYSNFRRVPNMEKFIGRFGRLPSAARNSAIAAMNAFGTSDRTRKLTALALSGGAVHPYFLVRALFSSDERQALFAGSGLNSAEESLDALFKEALHDCQSLDPVNRVSFLESKFYMRNTLLRDSDFMSMAHGLELRVPFLDRQLVEACFRIPGKEKLKGSAPKSLLLSNLGVELPGEIVNRPKRGFTLPFEKWLRGEMKPVVEDVLNKSDWEAIGISSAGVRQIWNRFLARKTSWSRPWSLFTLKRWCELNL